MSFHTISTEQKSNLYKNLLTQLNAISKPSNESCHSIFDEQFSENTSSANEVKSWDGILRSNFGIVDLHGICRRDRYHPEMRIYYFRLSEAAICPIPRQQSKKNVRNLGGEGGFIYLLGSSTSKKRSRAHTAMHRPRTTTTKKR